MEPVFLNHLSADVTKAGEKLHYSDQRSFVGKGAVHAYTQDLGVCGFQLGYVLLEAPHFLSSIG